MSSSTDDDSVGNISLTMLEKYVLDEDIEFNYHGPKVVPQNKAPGTIFTVNTIGTLHCRLLFCILLDSSFSCCIIKRSCLPQGVLPKDLTDAKLFKTLSGQLFSKQVVTLHDVHLPNFKMNWHIAQQCELVFDNDSCRSDIILSPSVLTKAGLKLDYAFGQMV
jgi:hypothetical protein